MKTASFQSLCCCSVTRSCTIFVTQWISICQAFLFFTICWSLLTLMFIESVMPSNHLILCHTLSSCPQSFPVSESLPMSWLFASDDQSIGASASASVLPVNTHGWYPLGLTFNKASVVIVLQSMMDHITPDHKPPVVLHLPQSQCPRVWVAHMMLSPAYGGSIESKL